LIEICANGRKTGAIKREVGIGSQIGGPTPSSHVNLKFADRLLAIERLNLAFLIDAEDKGSVRRG
jgi:hypothetical protein